jgi:glyoxylase-like metal-dependent hydrolase (beta-lactamase superfamily II)
MYELVPVGEKTYYIDCPVKMGIYRFGEREVCLIDSGGDKDAGKKVQNILDEQGWTLKLILNTHSNADHIGGNAVLQQRLGAPAYSSGIEACFNQYPVLEPSFLYGGFPGKALRNKFLMAQPTATRPLDEIALPEGLTALALEGHFFGMLGFHTPDGVWFLADCVMGENILEKYAVSFIYDVAAYLKTLDAVERLEGRWFVPCHAPACADIRPLAAANRAKVLEIADRIVTLCSEPLSSEEVVKRVFDHYGLTMDWNQYVLVGSTVRSYLSYLLDANRLRAGFVENRLVWSRVEESD